MFKYEKAVVLTVDDGMYVISTCRVSWVEMSGSRYQEAGVLVLNMELLPQFGTIVDIIIYHDNLFYFVCSNLITECFIAHYHCFKVSKGRSQYTITQQCDLVDHTVLSSYFVSSSNNMFVPLKYHLVENI